jgi:UDP-N-acetylmuramate: L-alanyl-gamma-D-glutamyl-meso-diaminopimelate ligase
VRFAFSRLVNLIPRTGALVAGWDSQIVRELAGGAFCPVESVGVEPGARWLAAEIDFSGEMTSFTVTVEGKRFGRYRSPLAGLFNVRNCLAVIAACETLGLDRERVAEAVSSFKSVKRRMEVRAVINGITIIDDFAHHPTAVRETLRGARQKYPGRRLVAVLEPRSYTAQLKSFQQSFQEALSEADRVVIGGLFHPERYSSATAISPLEMVAYLRAQGREAGFIPSTDEIVSYLQSRLEPGDVVVIMSNGSFGNIHEKLVSALNAL